MRKPIVGITTGDPAGIGAEIAARAVADPEVRAKCQPLVIGDLGHFERAIERMGVQVRPHRVHEVGEAEFTPGSIDVWDLENVDLDNLEDGKATADTGHAAHDAIMLGAELALTHQIGALVTAPVSKKALREAGYQEIGHTELLARATGSEVTMLVINGGVRVAHVTAHIPLRDVPGRISNGRVLAVLRQTRNGLVELGILRPRIVVAGLNPHAGEDGHLGREETEVISPAIRTAQAEGMDAKGPYPGETIYGLLARGDADVVVAMYHDQGHIAAKLQGIGSGVNITLGLPFVRTSPYHGAAFGMVGSRRATARGMVEAIVCAAHLAAKRET